MEEKLNETMLDAYIRYLKEAERSPATVEKYRRDTSKFYSLLPEDKTISKEIVIAFKQTLAERYASSSANSMLVAINGLLKFMGREDCCVKQLKSQRRFYNDDQEIRKEEYYRLISVAQKQRHDRIGLIMQTICSTGIRVSELKFITIQALAENHAHIRCKGKERIVVIPPDLKIMLLNYCKRKCVQKGSVFVTRNGNPIDRSNIWGDMKRLCGEAGVPPQKVFPHNLRHLFATTFYRLEKDLVHLADILGHSSIETTRIYTTTSSAEHCELLSRMGLVCVSGG